MTPPPFNVGTYVPGAPTSPRALVRHADLLTAYADATIEDEREAYLSHFVFGGEMQTHYAANRKSVAGFAGPCWCRWVVLDIDRKDPADALTDARRLVSFLHDRYPEADGQVPVYFSGSKGFHVLVELAHNPPPAVGFHRTARTLAVLLAARAGVRIDESVYDIAHIIRLPNTRHPRTGLFKRRIESDAFFRLDIDRIREHARHRAGDGLPAMGTVPVSLAEDWGECEVEAARATEARAERRAESVSTPDRRAPRDFLELLRFGVEEGQRHQKLFRCAAWLAEQGAPDPLVFALLTEPGRDLGLTPKDVDRQIASGIEHGRPLPPGATEFPFGANAPASAGGVPA